MRMRDIGRYEDLRGVKPEFTKEAVLRILRYLFPYWKQLILVFIILGAASVLGLVPSMLTKNIIDTAIPSGDMRLLSMLVLLSLVTHIVNGLLGVAETYLNNWISRHIVYDIRNQLYEHLEYMSLKFFSTVKPGDIVTRMTHDINGIESVFTGTVVQLFRNFLVVVITTVALFMMNWKLAILGMFVLPLFITPTKKVGRVRWQIASRTQQKLADLNQIIQENFSISGSTLVKIFTREKDEYRKFKEINREVMNLQIKESLAGRWFRMTMNVFTSFGPLMIFFYGGYLAIKGEITVGAIVAFNSLLQRLYNPVIQLSNLQIDLTRSMALFERIFEYMDKEYDVEDMPGARVLEKVEGRIEFENVCFHYEEGKEILKDISFTAEPGQMIALVGPSGAGKTTITNLIPRLYDVTGGCVRIDGIDVRHVTQESLRSHIAVVTQDTYLFNGTIRENLLFAKQNATEEEIVEACKAANIHDFIMSLPENYDTVVGNRGMKLSGGEKQRISIARAILKGASILILDEATSSLDSVSESLIQQAIEPLLKGKTSFVIAHRLSTIMSADKILVINNGTIAETGTHEELYNKGGLYTSLCLKQFGEKRKGDEHETDGEPLEEGVRVMTEEYEKEFTGVHSHGGVPEEYENLPEEAGSRRTAEIREGRYERGERRRKKQA